MMEGQNGGGQMVKAELISGSASSEHVEQGMQEMLQEPTLERLLVDQIVPSRTLLGLLPWEPTEEVGGIGRAVPLLTLQDLSAGNETRL